MSAERQMKVLSNCDQGLSAGQKAQARANIDAQATLSAGTNVSISSDNVISATDTTYSAGTNISISEQNVISATDTTYSVFNTTTDGLVPKSNSDTGKFLKGDGTWSTPPDTTYSAGPNIDIYNGVISTEKPRVTAGTNVSVTSSLDQQTRTITYNVSATDTTYNVFNTTTDGLVPKASGTGDTGKFLKGDGTWDTPAGASTVKKLDYGESSASTVSTLLIDSDDVDGYSLVKCDSSTKGYLVAGPYATLLNSGINGGSGIGDASHTLYIDGNGMFQQGNSVGSEIKTISDPYTTTSTLSSITIYDPGSTFGSVVQDQSSNTIGYFVPKYNSNTDTGKVLTVVNDSGYKCKWHKLPELDLENLALETMEYYTLNPGSNSIALPWLGSRLTMLQLESDAQVDIYLEADSTAVETKHCMLILANNIGGTYACTRVVFHWQDETTSNRTTTIQFGTTYNCYIIDVFAKKVPSGNSTVDVFRVLVRPQDETIA